MYVRTQQLLESRTSQSRAESRSLHRHSAQWQSGGRRNQGLWVLDAEAKVEKEVLIDDAIVSGCEEGEDV